MSKAQRLIECLQSIIESRLSRVWKHIEVGGKFGVVSGSRSEHSKVENQAAHMELKNIVRSDGYGYIEMRGGFVKTLEDGSKLEVKEDTLFIPNISKKEIIDLGIKFDQDSVLYKDDSTFYEFGTSKRKGIGKILTEFNSKSGRDNLDFSGELLKKYFSSLKKGSHRGRKFLFKKILEKVNTGMSQVYSQKLDNEWTIIMTIKE